MKKLTLVIAALATIAIAVPTMASAEDFGVRVGGDHGDRGRARAEMHGERHHDRNWRSHRAEGMFMGRHRRHHRDY